MTPDLVVSQIQTPTDATVKYSLGILLILNLIMKAAFSYSLQMLWDYINSLQMVALMPLMNLSLPPNLLKMLNYIAGPLSFNYLSQTNLALYLFQLDPDQIAYPQYNELFTDFGFDTSLAVLNLQDTVVYLTIFILGLPLTYLLVKLPKVKDLPKVKKISEYLKSTFMFGFIIRLFVENFMPIFLACLINMYVRGASTSGELRSTVFAFILFVSQVAHFMSIVHDDWYTCLGNFHHV